MRLVILGSGGYGRTVADVASQLNYDIIILDDSIPGHPLSSFSDYLTSTNKNSTNNEVGEKEEVEFIPAFGNNEFRLDWCNRIEKGNGKLATLIHPSSYISPTSKINPGTVILSHAIINTDVVVGKGCIINCGAIVDHGCVIEEGCHVCLGAIVKGENQIKAKTKIEAGEVIEARTYPLQK